MNQPAELANVVHLVEPFLDVSKLANREWDKFRYVLKVEVRRP